MADPASQIGEITIAYGTTTAEGDEGVRPLSAGSPVFADDLIKTSGPGSAVEIKFIDGALLSQGPNSSIVLDSYVFNPDQSAGEMTVKLLEGTFRSVTGEIVDLNPEAFSLETPLATIGIRGTTTGHTVAPNGQEAHVVVDFVDKPVVIRSATGGPVRVVTQDGMSVSATSTGISPVFRATQSQLASFEQLSSQSLQQGAPVVDPRAAEEAAEEAEEAAEEAQEVAEEAAEEAAAAEAEAEAAEAAAQAAAEAAAQAAAEAEAAAQAAAELAAQAAADAAAQAAAEAAAAEAAALAQAAAEAAAQQAAAEAAQAAAEAAAQAAQQAAAEAAAEAAAAQAAAQAAAAQAAAAQAATVPAPTTDPQTDQGDDGQDGDGDDGDDGGDPGDDPDDTPDPTGQDVPTNPVVPPPTTTTTPPPTTGTTTPTPTAPTTPEPPPAAPEPDPIDDGNTNTENVVILDLSNWGDNLTVDLDASPAYYQTTGDDSTKVNLVNTNLETFTVTTVFGETSYDNIIIGNDVNNQLYGGTGANSLDGGLGNDLLAVGSYDSTTNVYTLGQISNDDSIAGGDGVDTLKFDGNSTDTLDGGALGHVSSIEYIVTGNSAVDIASTPDALVDSGTTLQLDASLASSVRFMGDNDTDSSFYMVGSAGNDTLAGSTLADTLFGGLGDDCLIGNAGDDTIAGTSGGADSIASGDDDDAIYMGTKLDVNDVIDGGSGHDTLNFTDATSSGDDLDNVSNVETIILGTTATTIAIDADGIVGSGETATINGTWAASLDFDASGMSADNAFHIIGTSGADTIVGGGQEDTIEGGLGADSLDGGLGNDLLSYSIAVDDMVIDLDADSVSGLLATGDTIVWSSFTSAAGGSGDDSITGDASGNLLIGNGGVDTLSGGDGDDTFRFNTGDIVTGEEVLGGAGTGDMISVQTSTDFTHATMTDLEKVEIWAGQTATFDVGKSALLGGLTTIIASGTTAVETFGYQGTDGNDSLDISSVSATFLDWGSEDLFKLEGFGGDDTITGGAKNDIIEGGDGADVLDGGGGTNTLTYASSTVGVSIDMTGQTASGGHATGDTITWASFSSIVGGSGGDSITGTTGNETLSGGAGNDFLYGGGGSDTVLGGTGDDTIAFNPVAQTADGGDGTDTMRFDGASEDFTASTLSNFEVLQFNHSSADSSTTFNLADLMAWTVTVSAAADAYKQTLEVLGTVSGEDIDLTTLTLGTNWDTSGDVLSVDAEAGDDTITGSAGSDLIMGDAGADSILGGAGADTIYGADSADGTDGADTIDGGAGDDSIWAEGANDVVSGGLGGDYLNGGTGNDTMDGGDGNDSMDGWSGDDSLSGGAGDDTIHGYLGADTIEGGAGADTLSGGDDNDTLSYASDTSGVSVNLATGATSGGHAEGDDISAADFEGVLGGSGNDSLTGSTNVEVLKGGAGNDTLTSGQADTLLGEAGNDSLTGGAGDDYMSGGDGADYLYGAGGADTIYGDAGNDTIAVNPVVTAGGTIDGGDDTDTILIAGTSEDLTAATITGIEVVEFGNSSADSEAIFNLGDVQSWTINVSAAASAYTQTLHLVGTTGGDTYTLSTTTDFTLGSNWDGADDILKFAGGDGADSITGSAKTEYLLGEAGNDTLWGVSGNDTLVGGLDNDSLISGDGNTLLQGEDGNDVLRYADGVATLQGGVGDDTIELAANVEAGSSFDGGDGTADVLKVVATRGMTELTALDGVEILEMSAGTSTAFDADLATGKTWEVQGQTSSTEFISMQGFTNDGTYDFSGLTFTNWDGADGDYLKIHNIAGGSEHITGSVMNDSFSGSSGQDTYIGLAGDDTMDGGVGHDSLDGGSGNDSLLGGEGNDILKVDGNDSAYLNGGAGDDSLNGGASGNGGSVTLVGGAGVDSMYGAYDSNNIFEFDTGDVEAGEIIDGADSGGIDSIVVNSSTDFRLASTFQGIERVMLEQGQSATFTSTQYNDGWTTYGSADSGGAESLLIHVDTAGQTLNIGTLEQFYASEGDYVGVIGSSGADTIVGTSGRTSIDGGDGDDAINGGGGEDTLLGGAGNDTFYANGISSGASIDGGSGTTNTIITSADVDFSDVTLSNIHAFEFQSGTSTATFTFAQGDQATSTVTGIGAMLVNGTSGDDDLDLSNLILSGYTGILKADMGVGDDTVTITNLGLDGTMDVDGGAGTDVLNYSDANSISNDYTDDFANLFDVESVILTGAGINTSVGADLFTTDSILTIDATALTDFAEIDGTSASDAQLYITGSDYLDSLTGGALADSLSGGQGEDTLIGNGGNDTLAGDTGDDSMVGGLGDDLFIGHLGADTMVGGDGSDTVDYSGSTEGVRINLATNDTIGGYAALDVLSGIEGVIGSDYSDTLTTGADGNYYLDGGDGDDTLNLNNGGTDTLIGGAGDDSFIVTTAGSGELDGGDDIDTVTFGVNSTIDMTGYTSITGIENIVFGATDTVIVSDTVATGANWVLSSNISSQKVFQVSMSGTTLDLSNLTDSGLDTNWTMYDSYIKAVGTSGDDTIVGSDGKDSIETSTGADSVEGGAGDDTITGVGANGSDGNDIFDGGAGNDSLIGKAGNDTLLGGDGDDYIAGEGGTGIDGDDSIDGGAGNDTIWGEGAGLSTTGNDIIFGGIGDDLIYGQALNDTIDGGLGADTINGGTGNDSLTGGDGADQFQYADKNAVYGGAIDTITDFVSGTDSLYFYSGFGSLSYLWFEISGGAEYSGTVTGGVNDAVSLIWDSTNQKLWVDSDSATADGASEGVIAYFSGGPIAMTDIVVDGGSVTLGTGESWTGTTGNDTYVGTSAGDTVFGLAGNDTLNGADGNDSIDGGDDDDLLLGGVGNDTLLGGTGDDSLSGGDGDDTLYGQVGADSIEGGLGNDSINGGDNDEAEREFDIADYMNSSQGIYADLTSNSVNGWDGSTTVSGGDGSDVLNNIEGVRGTAYADKFVGDNTWANVFVDAGGSDIIDGNSVYDYTTDLGFDIVSYEFAGQGIITSMNGQAGTVTLGGDVDTLTDIDLIIGTDYADTLNGGAGEQEFMPGLGNDTVDGLETTLAGANGEDWDNVTYWDLEDAMSFTFDGTKWVAANTGAGFTDHLYNIESIEGTEGDDTFIGGSDDDEFAGWKGADSFVGGGGFNTVSYSSTALGVGVAVDQEAGTATDGWGNTDTLSGIQGVEGSDFEDTLMGDSGMNLIDGNEGNDLINGLGGADSLFGDDGDDTFVFTVDADYGTIVDGDAGSNIIQIDGNVDLLGLSEAFNIQNVEFTTDSSALFDAWAIDSQTWNIFGDSGMEVINIELVSTQDLDLSGLTFDSSWDSTVDEINVTGSASSDAIIGSFSDDEIMGGDGDDSISGGDGDDAIMAYGIEDSSSIATADTLDGGAGSDTLMDMAQTVDFRNMTLLNFEHIEFGVDNPTGQSYTFDGSQLSGQSYVISGGLYTSLTAYGTSGMDNFDFSGLDLSGFGSHMTVYLSDNSDTVIGSSGDDNYYGGTGHDLILGGAGDDTLTGDGGDDTLKGGDGDDFMTGGIGSDVFEYEYGSAINLAVSGDTISGFESGTDRFWLVGTMADTPLEWYVEDNYDGIIDTAATDQPVLVWDSANSVLWYDDKPQDSDGAYQGVMADMDGGILSMSDIFAENTTITDPGTGNVVMTGSIGADTLTATGNSDTLFGYDGNDQLNGTATAESFIGGDGLDTITGNGGDDTVSYAYDQNAVAVDLSESLFWGTGGNSAVDGGGSADSFNGIANVTGSSYNDTLVGDANVNILEGGAGADFLFGNGGADELYGVQGADLFLIADNTETGLAIQDFQSGLDGIALGGDYFSGLLSGGIDASEFSLEVAVSYDGIAGADSGEGLVYVSNGTTGELWFDMERSTSGNEYKIADIVEFDVSGNETDNDLDYTDFIGYSIPQP
ncbi:FecR domain-containing protein [Pseudodesulfovibrio sp. zrk46]|uniref:FecR domain-containing protein n=1 Tax=Pseudodesulfovibrio sp. zrk46 TaxID=2725288 RepID=UPI00144A04C0|nr:FecR domain-containing protein [Pseudodesulfovibrio sp. zrk46]QJB56188.1 hypothetical protein HFN16_07080 [Pseudodesulfovibrio sp. zrk46]